MPDDLRHFKAPTLWPRIEFLMELIGAVGFVYLFAVVVLALAKVAA